MNESEFATLAPDQFIDQRELLIVGRNVSAAVVRRGLIEDGLLSAYQSTFVERDFFDSPMGRSWITADNPFLTDEHAAQLVENGLVRPGTVVRLGTRICSALEPVVSDARDKLAAGQVRAKDRREEFPAAAVGYVVESVRYDNIRYTDRRLPDGVTDRIEVSLNRCDTLVIGDRLQVQGSDVVVGSIAADDEMPRHTDGRAADIVVPSAEFSERDFFEATVKRRLPSAVDRVIARGMGPYSLITQQPLGRHEPGQIVTPGQISWLRRNDCFAIAAELASLKSDDTLNRIAIREWAKSDRVMVDDIVPGCPETLSVLIEELRSLGVDVQPQSAADHVSLDISAMSDDALRASAPPTIRKPETINYRTFTPVEGGIFCEAAFGPEQGVRRRTAAHIPLGAPIVPIIYRLGRQPILSRLLDRDCEEIEALVARRTGIRIKGDRFELVPNESEGCEFTGAEAIEQMLASANCEDSGIDVGGVVQRSVYLCPPDIRPLVLLDSCNFATSDLNDHYRQIVNRNNRLSKLIDLKAPAVIAENEKRELQACVDRLHANTRLAEPLLGSGARPLKDCLDLALQRLTETRGKRVDWSAVGPMVSDSSVAIDEVLVPQRVYTSLSCAAAVPLLVAAGDRFAACSVTATSASAIVLNPRTAAFLGVDAGELCFVHRPVTATAVEEARTLQAKGVEGEYAATPVSDDLEADAALEQIIDCLWSQRSMALDSPAGFLLGGAGNLEIAPDGVGENKEGLTKIVPLPAAPPPPTVDEVREFIEAQKRPTCVFDITPDTDSIEPESGRFGGRPWLPPNAQWPFTNNEPIPFLAQLPLEAARAAGALPIAVPENSLLTIFWPPTWWELGQSTAPVLLIHGTEGLEPADPPPGLTPTTPCRINAQIRHELPGSNESMALLHRKFQTVPDEISKQLNLKELLEENSVKEQTRVGGSAFWVQEGCEPIVAQIVSDETTDISFGDCGSLYIVGDSSENLFAYVQSY